MCRIAISICTVLGLLAGRAGAQQTFDIPLRIQMGGVTTTDSFGRVWLGEGPGGGDPLNIRPNDAGGANWIENWSTPILQPDSLENLGYDPTHPGDVYIFDTIRWDTGNDGIDFLNEIPVPNGTYQVNMFFNEDCCTQRHFKIEIQGDIVDDDVSYLSYDPANPALGRVGRLSFNGVVVQDKILRIGLLPCPDCPDALDTNAIIDALEVVSGPGCDNQGLDFNCSFDPATGGVTGTFNPIPDADHYHLLRNGQPVTFDISTAPPFSDPSPVEGGQSPAYTLQALSGATVVGECRCTVNVCPRDLTCAATPGSSEVVLSWTAGGAGITTGYEVRRNGNLVATLPSSASTFTDHPVSRIAVYLVTPLGPACDPLSCQALIETLPFEVPARFNMGGVQTVDSHGNVWLGDGPGPGDPLGIRPNDAGGANWIENWSTAIFQPDSLDALGFDSTNPNDVYIFNTIRWDDAGLPGDFLMDVPIPDGEYQVNMYFNEGCCMGRHFKISLQGKIVDDDVSYLDYDPNNQSLGRVGLLTFTGSLVEEGLLHVGLLPCPECVGATDNNAIIDALEILPTGPLPARVVRSLSKETFQSGDVIDVTLTVTPREAGKDIQVQETLPALAAASQVSDGGVLTGNTIQWALTGVTSKVLSYKLAPASCASQLQYGPSSWKLDASEGTVTGKSALTRVAAPKDFDPWQTVDVGPAAGVSEPLAEHDLFSSAQGAGIKLLKDEFHFVYVQAQGDFEVSGRIDCLDDAGGSGLGGLMVRDTLDAFSANAFFGLSSAVPVAGGVGTLRGFYRRETNATTNRSTSPISISSKDVASLPIYMSLKRTGGQITFSRSSDGQAFTQVGSKDIGTTSTTLNLGDTTLIGFAVTGGGTGTSGFTFKGISGPPFSGALPPPNTPQNLKAVAGDQVVDLSWDEPAPGPDFTGYVLLRDGNKIAEQAKDTRSYHDQGLQNDVLYQYQVEAVRGSVASAPSGAVSATPTGPKGNIFRRGDIDANGVVEITDAVKLLGYLFLGGGTPECLEAGDTDNNGVVDITDAVTNLGYQFLGATPPAAPGPLTCGPDPAEPMLGCDKGCQ
jgi:hypothetical protein